MNKSGFVKALAQKSGMNRENAAEAVDRVFDTLGDVLVANGVLRIKGVGTFSVHRSEAREGRNPRTGEAVHIAACKKIRFKAGKDLKDKVNG